MMAVKKINGAAMPDDSRWDGPDSHAVSSPKVWTPKSAVEAWRSEGKVERLATGFETFDNAMRGGFPIGYFAVVAGAPNAGKTAWVMHCAHRWATDGIAVGVLGVDEHALDLTVRLAQMQGYSIDECEERDPVVLSQIIGSLEELPIRMYDAEHTIESAAADIDAYAKKIGSKRVVLIGDSIQTNRSIAARGAETPRAMIDANVIAFRREAVNRRMVTIGTSEMPRSGYRNEQSVEGFNDMAAGKDSGSIEYQARTQIVLRTVKDQPGVIHARVPKMKPGGECEFWLALNKARHSLSERGCPDSESTTGKETAKVAKARKQVAEDVRVLTGIVLRRPGIGERELRAELKRQGHRWGVLRLDATKLELEGVLENRGPNARQVQWHIRSEAADGGADEA
jgi:KaiC/GvpD/RAD55 family RecA-like ATPase